MDQKNLPYLNYWKRKTILNQKIVVPTIEYWVDANGHPLEKYLFDKLLESKSILDFGAGDKKIKDKLNDLHFQGSYFSLDFGNEHDYDFKNLVEIDRKFETILMLDVIEHMPLEEGLSLSLQLLDKLDDCGELIIQTPNAKCVRNHLGSDMTHLQLYNVKDLYAYFKALNYIVEAKRIVFKKRNFCLINSFYNLLSKILITRILGLDFADNILLVIKKSNL